MPTPYDDSILRSLRRIIRATNIYSRHLAAKYELTTPQLTCLRTVTQNGEFTSGGLAAEMVISQATVTGIVDRLEARGLVTRQRDTRDKRRVLIRSTAEGRRLVASAPAPLQKQFADRLAEAPPEQQQQIDRVLRQIVAMMSAERLDASPVLVAGPMDAQPEETADFLATETEEL